LRLRLDSAVPRLLVTRAARAHRRRPRLLIDDDIKVLVKAVVESGLIAHLHTDILHLRCFRYLAAGRATSC
jgi:hypothetical protein